MGRTFLIRHANTKSNSSDVVRSINNIPLDDAGIRQAVQTGHSLSQIPLHNIITSKMGRAIDTAKIIASLNVAKPKVQTTPELNPIDWGTFTGKSVKAVQPQLNEYLKSPNKKIPGGGTVAKSVNSAKNVINKVSNGTSNENTGIVMHNSHFRALPHILDPKKSLVKNSDLVPPGGVVELLKDKSLKKVS